MERVKGKFFFFVTPNFFRKEPSSSILSFTKILVCCSQGLSALSRKQIKTHDLKMTFLSRSLKWFCSLLIFLLINIIVIMTGRATVFPFFFFLLFLVLKKCAHALRLTERALRKRSDCYVTYNKQKKISLLFRSL